MLEAYAETMSNAVQQVGCIILVRMVIKPQLPCIVIKGSGNCCEVGGQGGWALFDMLGKGEQVGSVSVSRRF